MPRTDDALSTDVDVGNGSAVVRVEPAGYEIEVRPGETLIRAAWRAGYSWPTLCFGVGKCTACQCEVVDGSHLLSERTEPEIELLRECNRRVRRIDPRRLRLACQVQITGNVVVRKPGVKYGDTVNAQENEDG